MTNNVIQEIEAPGVKNYIVGIGASAGGMEAVHAMFDSMPENTGFSFVVIQHLSPDHKSLLAELLSKHTVMQVYEAEDDMDIRPNCIYVIPSKKLISVCGHKLKLVEKLKSALPNNAVDIFFASLAEEKGNCAVGIILSGTGSDGKKGIEEIKKRGGIVVVQDPLTAAFDGMPNSAIDTGFADLVLPPEMMAEELLEFVKGSPYLRTFAAINQKDEIILRHILTALHNKTQYDFNHYKKPTILRRLAKRMAEIGIKNIEDYRDYLDVHPDELKILYKQFLINVTKFFRDSEVFEVLRTLVIPAIISEKKEDEPVKVWIAACSSGEEAYSLAILFKEQLDKMNRKDSILKIFATDIDSEALDIASRGIYPDSIANDIPPKYLKKYFIPENDNMYRIDVSIRKLIVFANHDVLKDPPFSHLDLVSCRNMLIYIDPSLQKKVLKKFHFALNTGSYMVLGLSESISILKHSMQEIDRKWKIYKCITKTPPADSDNYLTSFESRIYTLSSVTPKAKNPLQNIGDIFKDTILSAQKYAGILVDKEFEVKNATGNFKSYFNFPENNFNFNLLKIVPQDLAITLGVCLRKAMNQNEAVIMKRVKVGGENQSRLINIIVKPYLQVKEYAQSFLFVVLHEEELQKESKILPDETIQPDARVDELERELMETRESLQAIIEEVETANEELQSSNEEMISFNEELQSTNEELQSLNEELHTVSAEHQLKIKELLELNDDMNNYFRNSDIGQIILDKRLVIRKFSPAVSRMVNLIEADIGRSIVDITTNIKNIDFVNDIKEAIKTNESIEKEVNIKDNSYYLMRISPYIRQDKAIEGAVINFIDITEVKKLTSIIEGVFNSSTSGIVAVRPITDKDGIILDFEYMAANKSAEILMHASHGSIIGKTMLKTFPDTPPSFITLCGDVVAEGKTRTGEYFNERSNSWFEITVVKILEGLVITFTDITDRKTVANLLAKNYEDLKIKSKQLIESNAKLEESNLDLMQFASIASHDLKEPLRKVQAFGNLLESKIKDKLEKEEGVYLKKIITATMRMQLLIEDVLTLSKLSNKDIPFEKTNLGNILKGILEDLEISIKEKNAKIIYHELPVIEAVPGQMHQMLQNLVVNALKFNDKPKPEIIIASEPVGKEKAEELQIKAEDFVNITITDNGMGFEEQYKDKIFGIFQRLHGRNFEGTGIGLAIAKKIIENHCGYISAESKLGEETRFNIILPYKQKSGNTRSD